MHLSISEPLDILKWGYRLLYLELALFVLVSMFYFDYPITLPYLGAILALFYVALIWKNHNTEAEMTEKVLLNEQ